MSNVFCVRYNFHLTMLEDRFTNSHVLQLPRSGAIASAVSPSSHSTSFKQGELVIGSYDLTNRIFMFVNHDGLYYETDMSPNQLHLYFEQIT